MAKPSPGADAKPTPASPPRACRRQALRDELALNPPKFGCGQAKCGSCTVLIDGGRAVLLDLPTDGVAVVALVAMKDAGGRHLLQQSRSGRAIGDVSAGEQEGDRPAIAIG